MKMNVKINNKEQVIDVDFWSFFKGFTMCYATMMGILFVIGLIIGMMLI